MKLEYNYFTDIDMNTIAIPIIPEAYKVSDKVKEFFIQGYGDGSFDVIVRRHKDSFHMQGCYFSGDSKAVCITGFKMNRDNISIHFKTSKKAKSLVSAKKAMKLMFSGLIQVKGE